METHAHGTILFERYEILASLGHGANSSVFKARDVLMDRLVALKIINKNSQLDASLLERFKQEGKLAGAIHHDGVAELYSVGTTNENQMFLVSEFIDGHTLAEKLAISQKLEFAVAAPIIIQVCAALSEIHKEGIIHRDLKPSNIMLKQSNANTTFQVKLIDFGIAKQIGQSPELTQASDVLGSVAYMSPEQIRHEELDPRSDIYSLACVFYELLEGQPPFQADSDLSILSKHLNEAPNLQNFAEQLKILLAKALSKRKDDRFSCAQEFAAAIQLCKISDKKSFCSTKQCSIVFSLVVLLLSCTAFFIFPAGRKTNHAYEFNKLNLSNDFERPTAMLFSQAKQAVENHELQNAESLMRQAFNAAVRRKQNSYILRIASASLMGYRSRNELAPSDYLDESCRVVFANPKDLKHNGDEIISTIALAEYCKYCGDKDRALKLARIAENWSNGPKAEGKGHDAALKLIKEIEAQKK